MAEVKEAVPDQKEAVGSAAVPDQKEVVGSAVVQDQKEVVPVIGSAAVSDHHHHRRRPRHRSLRHQVVQAVDGFPVFLVQKEMIRQNRNQSPLHHRQNTGLRHQPLSSITIINRNILRKIIGHRQSTINQQIPM